jgi:aspartate aminotransferase
MTISDKMRQLAHKSSWIRKMFEEGAKMKATYGADNVYDFSLGNPDAPPPPEFFQVIRDTIRDDGKGVHGYMPNGGYPWVREAIAARMSTEQGMTISHGDMLMACGAAGALNVVMKTLLNPGEEVIILAPYFVDYGNYIENFGGVTRVVGTDDEFDIDLAAIEEAVSEKTKGIFINSPNNPCGQIYSKEKLDGLGKLLDEKSKKYGNTIYMISDEPYRKIVFDNHVVPSIFTAYSNSIVVTSHSKDLSLPGERIGFLAVHPEIEDKASLLNGLTMATRMLGFINAPALMQRVVAELQDVTIDTSIYARRKELICTILRDAGYSFLEPKGAFYVFPETPIADDVKFVSILQEEKVLAVPGVGFGTPGYMRIAFCVPDDVITKSADSFKKAFDRARAL